MDHYATTDYMAHGFCFMWDPQLVWLHVISDVLTGIAYFSIPIAMGYFIFKRRDLPYTYIFVVFALFIFSCGGTHLFAAYTVYVPIYWQEGYLKAFTALISVIAAALFIPMIPKAIMLPSLPKALDSIKELNVTLAAQVEQLRIKDYALASSMNGIVFCDLDGKLTYANNSFLGMWGYESAEEVTGKSFADFWENANDALTVMDSLRIGNKWAGELCAKTKDSAVFHVSLNANTVVTSAGLPISYMSSFTDITNRKRAENAFVASETKYRELLESVNLIAVILDIEGNITFCNDYLLRLSGWTKDDIYNKNWFDLFIPEEVRQNVKAVYTSAILDGSIPLHNVNPITTREGVQRLIAWDNSILRNTDGAVIGVASIGNDITEHRKLEEQLRQSQKMESIGTLAGGIAHDFNNILGAVIGYGHMSLMKMRKDDPERLNIEGILEAADRAAHLTKDLLLFSRKQIGDRKPADLNNIIKRLEKFLKRVIGEDIACKATISEQPLTVLADSHQLEQILMNLATNARDAMPKGGAFIISTEQVQLSEAFTAAYGYGKHGAYALISVSDTGKGMDEATQQRIFEPFFTTKEVGKGTGLGLAVVYGIIKQHEGYINVYSELDNGTTFRIYLPLIDAAAAEEIKPQKEEVPECGTETVLLAEDDEALRKLSSTVLKQYGYTVIEAVDGEEAVRKFIENKDSIHLLLFDLIMPAMNGKEAFDEIQKIRPDMKVIFASGYAPDTLRQKASLEDNAHLLYKPISPFDLLRKVREVLDR